MRILINGFVAALVACCAGSAGAAHTDSPARPARNAAGAATVNYFGGTVTANPKVYVLWWGDPAKINSALTAPKGGIADFFAGVLDSSYMDWLNEYNTNINAQAGSHQGNAGSGQLMGRGNYVGTLTLTDIPSGNVTDDQIRSTLDAAFAANKLPQPEDNTLYMIYFPPGVTISLDGDKSCSAYGAYHDAILETTRHNVYYGVMPDCGSSFKSRTSVSSHELIEAMTDNTPTPGSSPDFPQAWNDSMGSELGDLCGSSGTVTTALGMFTVQTIWDERTQACQIFSSDAADFNVSVSPNGANLALGAPQTVTVKTATTNGAAQMLTLSVAAPAGVTATVSPTTVMSGGTASLTISATSAQSAIQVVVRADATTGTAVQTHTAALLLSTNSDPVDLGASPADLAPAAEDLAIAPTDGGVGDDAGTPGTGTGGNGDQMPAPKGCGCVIGAANDASALDGTWLAATLLLLGFGVMALRRRQRRA